jgi:hypothetical protein
MLIDHDFVSGQSYHLIYPEHKADEPVLKAFRDWVLAEAARDEANQPLVGMDLHCNARIASAPSRNPGARS